MTLRKRFAACFLSLLLTGALATVAVAQENYTYTVRFFAGQQGSIGGGEVIVHSNLHYGDRVTFHQSSVSLKNDSKYYIQGIRESGKDNNTVSATSFTVTGDQDYVVAYGLLGSAISYSILYEDANGNALAPSETYYGNVGDKPVIAYLYIDGYQPQAYNLTKTLSANAADNVFTFIYTSTATQNLTTPPANNTPANNTPATNTPNNNVNTPAVNDGTTVGTPAANDATADSGTANNGAADNGVADNSAADNTTNLPDADTPAAQPQQIEDLDDSETPLAGYDGTGDHSEVVGDNATLLANVPLPAKIAIGAITAVAAIGFGLWFIVPRRSKRKKK